MPSDKPYLEIGDDVSLKLADEAYEIAATLVRYSLPFISRDNLHYGRATLIGPKIGGEIEIPLFIIEAQNKPVREHFESRPLHQLYVSDFPPFLKP